MRWVLEIFFSFFSSLEVFGKYSFIFSMKVTSPRNLPFLGGKDLKGMLYFSNRSAIKFVIQKTWRRKVQKKALFFIPLHYYNFYWECGCTNKSGHGRALVEGGLRHSLSPQTKKKGKKEKKSSRGRYWKNINCLTASKFPRPCKRDGPFKIFYSKEETPQGEVIRAFMRLCFLS